MNSNINSNLNLMKKVIYGSLMFLPTLVFAQNLSGLTSLVTQIGNIIRLIVPIMFALAIAFFFWGVVMFIRAAGDPKKAGEGKSIMIWGVIAITVMVSVYGLVSFLQTNLGISTQTTIGIPTVP